MTIGQRIKKRREELGLTQHGLAEKTGISYGGIKNYEYNSSTPKGNYLQKLAVALKCSMDWLQTGDGPAPEACVLAQSKEEKSQYTQPLLRPEPLPSFEDLGLEEIMRFLKKEWRTGDPAKRKQLYEKFRDSFSDFNKLRPDASNIKWPSKEEIEEMKKRREELGNEKEEKDVA